MFCPRVFEFYAQKGAAQEATPAADGRPGAGKRGSHARVEDDRHDPPELALRGNYYRQQGEEESGAESSSSDEEEEEVRVSTLKETAASGEVESEEEPDNEPAAGSLTDGLDWFAQEEFAAAGDLDESTHVSRTKITGRNPRR